MRFFLRAIKDLPHPEESGRRHAERTSRRTQAGNAARCRFSAQALGDAQEVLAVVVLAQRPGQADQVFGGDEALAPGDLFQAGDLQALAVLEDRKSTRLNSSP